MPTKSSTTTISMPEPMQINASRIKKLTPEEKERRRREDLCMYCGGKGHRAHNCPTKVASPKPYKFRYTSTNPEDGHAVSHLENEDV